MINEESKDLFFVIAFQVACIDAEARVSITICVFTTDSLFFLANQS
jgi:stage V sporulation protein SpoVS